MKPSLLFFVTLTISCTLLCFGGKHFSHKKDITTLETLLILLEAEKYSKKTVQTFNKLTDEQKKAYIEQTDSWTKQSILVLAVLSSYKKYNKKNYFLFLKKCSCICPATTYKALCYWRDFLISDTAVETNVKKVLSLLKQIKEKHKFSTDEKDLYGNITNGNTILKIQNQIDDALRYLENEEQLKLIKQQNFYGESFERALARHITKKSIGEENRKNAQKLYDAFKKITS